MTKYLLLVTIFTTALIGLVSCSEDGADEPLLSEQIIGTWQLERIKIEGLSCKTDFGADVPSFYLTDSAGCVRPTAIAGSTKYCINFEFLANGKALALNSLSFGNGAEDEPLTYTIDESTGKMEYCYENISYCTDYTMKNGKLESATPAGVECDAIFVLKKI